MHDRTVLVLNVPEDGEETAAPLWRSLRKVLENITKRFNLCAGTVIDSEWILTSATCCKRDDIVTIAFNDYSIFYNDVNQHEKLSTNFHIHEDLDVCLIRTTDMSDIVTQIPCLNKVSF